MKYIPHRKCIACQSIHPQKEMIRVAKLADGSCHVDERQSGGGRGAYVCRDEACVELARKKNAFQRSFKSPVSDDLYDELKAYYEKSGNQDKILRLIGLARRAGELTYGQTAVLTELKKARSKLVLFASDFNDKTKDSMLIHCKQIQVLSLPYTMEELGDAIGTKPTGVLSMNHENFIKGILEVSPIEEKENI